MRSNLLPKLRACLIRRALFLALVALSMLDLAPRAQAVIALNAPTTDFTALALGGPSDPESDSQANRPDIELVGRSDVGLEAFYVGFNGKAPNSSTDGDWFFRVRVAGENGNSDGELSGFVYIGLDLTGDGTLDYMIEHGGSSSQKISILRAGAGSSSPATVAQGDSLFSESAVKFGGTNGNAANSFFETVENIDADLDVKFAGSDFDPYDLDDGGNKDGDLDRFLTFKLDFQDFVDVVRADAADSGVPDIGEEYLLFDDTFALQMLVVTSQNSNNINSDFGGIDDDAVDPDDPFVDHSDPNGGSGGLTQPVDPSGEIVPEPSAYALLLGLVALGWVAQRRRL